MFSTITTAFILTNVIFTAMAHISILLGEKLPRIPLEWGVMFIQSLEQSYDSVDLISACLMLVISRGDPGTRVEFMTGLFNGVILSVIMLPIVLFMNARKLYYAIRDLLR